MGVVNPRTSGTGADRPRTFICRHAVVPDRTEPGTGLPPRSRGRGPQAAGGDKVVKTGEKCGTGRAPSSRRGFLRHRDEADGDTSGERSTRSRCSGAAVLLLRVPDVRRSLSRCLSDSRRRSTDGCSQPVPVRLPRGKIRSSVTIITSPDVPVMAITLHNGITTFDSVVDVVGSSMTTVDRTAIRAGI
jgi:hypothetical protein